MATHARPRLPAEPRQKTRKKSELRWMRQHGQVPGSIFGHGDPQNIRIPTRDLNAFLRKHAPGGILDVELSGQIMPAIIREIDRHPLTGEVIALGLQRVDLRETLKATLPLVLHGEDQLIAEGLVLQSQMSEVEVHGRADLLPDSIVVEVGHLRAHDSLRIRDLPLPDGIEAAKDPDLPVLSVTLPTREVELAAELEAGAEEEEEARAGAGAA